MPALDTIVLSYLLPLKGLLKSSLAREPGHRAYDPCRREHSNSA